MFKLLIYFCMMLIVTCVYHIKNRPRKIGWMETNDNELILISVVAIICLLLITVTFDIIQK